MSTEIAVVEREPGSQWELPSQPRRVRPLKLSLRGPVVTGVAILLVTVGGFGAWAGLSPLSSAAVAPGVVTVHSSKKTIQHLEGGIIAELAVSEGATVQAGQVLLRLDETRARTGNDMLRGQFLAALALEARLLAERNGRNAIAFPRELTELAGDPKVAELVDSQQRLFDTRLTSRLSERDILKKRIDQLREQIGGSQAQKTAKGRQLALVKEEFVAVKELFDQGYERKPRLLSLQRAQALIEGEIGELTADIARAQQAIGETELRIVEIDNKFMQDVAAQTRDVQVQLSELRDRLRQSEEVLGRIDIRAPLAGTVVGLRFHTVGGVVAPGVPILDIVPAEDKLIIEARVRTLDIDVVRAGLQASIRLSPYKQRSTPTLRGTVFNVSADRLIEEKSGLPYYLAQIELDPESLKRAPNVALYPGMPAEVMIETGSRLAIDYLISPFTDTLNRAFREK
jgi:HlyD family type I secretion membrane fusion protein